MKIYWAVPGNKDFNYKDLYGCETKRLNVTVS